MEDKYYMEIALAQAKKAREKDEVPIGAVVVKDGEVIAEAYNQKEEFQDATNHAEMIALKKAQQFLNTWHLEDCTLYVTLEPCLMCTGAIILTRLKKVVYGTEDLKGGALVSNIKLEGVKGLNHYPTVVGGVMKEECSRILKEYFKDKRNKK